MYKVSGTVFFERLFSCLDIYDFEGDPRFLRFLKGYKKRITLADLLLKAKTDCFSCTSC